nr:DUF6516 family protein [uncultured Desulfobacter sp.]
MNAELILKNRHIISETSFAELIVWRISTSLPGSKHNFKYRLAFIVDNACVLRYDNETGKGDHKHIGDKELPYEFKSPKTLMRDFWKDVDNWRGIR